MTETTRKTIGHGIDESTLTHEERLGLAYCRLNSWEWDEYIGEKPAGFDEMPKWEKGPLLGLGKRKVTKSTYIALAIPAIKAIIGEAGMSWYWWRYALNRPHDEWYRWYMTEGGAHHEKV